MSGGVDSSVTAALLAREGYEVIGITMQIWHRSDRFGHTGPMQGCCTIDAVDDARRVAHRLGIRYYVPNFREEMRHNVVDEFARDYVEGRTPNPCVRCNQFVRFDGLIGWADELGIDYVATGHYARVGWDDERGEYTLRKAVDPRKDQSYMLHTLGQAHLRRILFPLGDMPKTRTRELAREMGLPVAEKPDSQEICFVAGGNYREFLKEFAGVTDRPGEIVDTTGRIVGRHDGVHGYTVGQRKGLGIAAPDPRYVVELRPTENRVVVGDRDDVTSAGVVCSRLAWTGRVPEPEFNADVKIRYRSPEKRARITHAGDCATVRFQEPVWAPAPGQLAVFYDGDRVVGGGTIDAPIR
jgi:tRNA-specific 2-thiouridylase